MPPSTDPDQPIPRLLIVDADRRVRRCLAELVEIVGEMASVMTTDRANEALRLLDETGACVAVVDPHLPDESVGLELVRAIRAARPAIRIVVIGASACFAAQAASSVDAFVPSDRPVAELLDAISIVRARGVEPGPVHGLAPSGLPDSVASEPTAEAAHVPEGISNG